MATRYEAGEVNVVLNAEAVVQLVVSLLHVSGVVDGIAFQATSVRVVVDPISHVVDAVPNAKTQTPRPVVVETGGVIDAVEIQPVLVVVAGQVRHTGPISTIMIGSL